MNKRFVNYLLILMLIALTIMTITGLMFVFDIKNHFAKELHEVTGLIFIGLIFIHIIVFRKVAYSFLFGQHKKK